MRTCPHKFLVTLTANQLDSLSGVFRRLLTGVLEANRSVLGAASAGELAVQQLLQASGIEATTGTFGRTDIGGDLRGNRATVSRAVGGRFDGQRFEGDDFHISGSSTNDIFHRINDLDGKLYNCKYVTEYCFPKAPVIAETTCSDCRRTDSAEFFSGQANALVKRCQHGCDYQWQLGDVSGSCSSGSIGEGGQRKISCPVSASLDAGERRRTFIDLVAVNANDTTKRTSHRFAVDWEREEQQNTLEDIANYRLDVRRTRRGSSTDIYPTINDKDYPEWGSSECPNCEWSYTLSNVKGELYDEDRGDYLLFGADNIRCEETRAAADVHLKIYNPDTGESVSWIIETEASMDNYDPRDCRG